MIAQQSLNVTTMKPTVQQVKSPTKSHDYHIFQILLYKYISLQYFLNKVNQNNRLSILKMVEGFLFSTTIVFRSQAQRTNFV